MKTDDKIEDLNKLLNHVLGAEPLVEYSEPMDEPKHEQNYALAQMYANKGYRTYLEDAVNRSIKSAAINSGDMTSLIYNKARIIAYKELLVVSKRAFESLEKIKKLADRNASNEKG